MTITNSSPGWSAWIGSGIQYVATALTEGRKKAQEQYELKCKEEEERLHIHKWGLDFDPMYGMIRLGIVGLMDENTKRNGNQKGGIKIAIHDHKIYIEKYDCIQSLRRSILFEDRKELLSLKKHIIKAIEWFPPQKCIYYRTIFEHAIKGLECLRHTYGLEEDGTEEDFTSRGIQQDIALIQKALDDPEFSPEEPLKITAIRNKISEKVHPTIGEIIELHIYEKIVPLWDLRNPLGLQTLHNNFLAKKIDSIRTDIRYNPDFFGKILKGIPFPKKAEEVVGNHLI